VNMQDPIADLLTRIRNSQASLHEKVVLPFSKIKEGIARVLCEEGYIQSYSVTGELKKDLEIELKYYRGKPVINRIKRISKVGLRVYRGVGDLQDIPGFGIAVVSTSQGIMSHPKAKELGIGGEVLCEVA
jgi:small subunit ribosomal protein S8